LVFISVKGRECAGGESFGKEAILSSGMGTHLLPGEKRRQDPIINVAMAHGLAGISRRHKTEIKFALVYP